MKRAFDIILTLLLLTVTWPIILAIMIVMPPTHQRVARRHELCRPPPALAPIH